MNHVQRMDEDAATTLNVYTSRLEDDLDDVADRLDAPWPRRFRMAPPAGFEPATQGLGNLCSIP